VSHQPKRKRNNPCGKMRYRSYEHAKTVRATRSHTAGIRLRVYLCPSCKGYHLTKKLHGTD